MLVDQIEPSLGEVIIVSYDGGSNSESGSYEGNGTAVLDNDCKYEGEFRNGMFHGKGIFTWPRGVKFEGDFEAGQILGKGSYEWSDGSIYVGEVRGGLRHGPGKFTGSSGQVYEGEWASGMRHGKGKIWYNEDRTIVYTGDWIRNLRHGYGSMKYASGNTYEGEWLDDKKSGTGLMVWRDVDEVYTGQWLNDLPHGLGEHIWGDSASHSVRKETCNIYRGSFVQGRREGEGAFFYMNGSMYSGGWMADLKQGEGIFIYADGRIFGGLFHQNRMITDFAKEESSAPRATEAVNPQFKLHISDLFRAYPNLLNSSVGKNAASSPVRNAVAVVKIGALPTAAKANQTHAETAAVEVMEMERLLLKYNHYLRNAFRRYTDFANKRRLGETLRAHQLLAGWSPQDTVHRLHKTCATARIFQKRFFCMNLEQMLRFLRESGVVGPFFRSYDLTQCLVQMRAELEMSCVDKLREYNEARRQFQQGSDETKSTTDEEVERMAELIKYLDLQVPTLMDGYLHPQARQPAAFQALSCQPLLEREFVELFVRSLAVKYARAKGVSALYSEEAAAVTGMSLTQLLYYVLAHKLLPLVSDFEEQVPAFYREFYYEEVQTLLYSSEVPVVQNGANPLDEPLQPLPAATSADATSSVPPGAPALDASTGEVSLTFFEKLWVHLKRVDAKTGPQRYEEARVVEVAETLLCGHPLGAFHAAGPPALNDIPSGGSVPLRVLLDFLMDQRGDAVSSDATAFSLLMAMECAPPSPTAPNPVPATVTEPVPVPEVPMEVSEAAALPADPRPQPSTESVGPKHNPLDFDLTCTQSRIDFHDCLELICRVASSPSNVWVLAPPPIPPAAHDQDYSKAAGGVENHGQPRRLSHLSHHSRSGKIVSTGAAAEGDEDSVSVYSVGIADILSERIGFWKQTFDVKKFLI